ncbi:uncharacterized protein PV07_12721 [Cladophialophora immunda]|uniref:Uncharacterized protein n=1 Tax=Cladophialophora immunda TaxID=569365 RepID=A0A0D2BS20_9EURO|nr:uncharacterized protein PV07_12721 [Cladophialophora immunda]KIW21858.1 hypothetical protein PV07_12721 [Cladophialophora immunda]
MIINDLGKDTNLEEDIFFQTGERLEDQNHDSILLAAAEAGMIAALNYLTEEKREEVMLGLELGSELNAGQLAQAESVPVNLEGLLAMRGHEHAFELKFMEQILDVAGARGHLDACGSKSFNEPVFQAFKTVHEVSLDIIAGKCNPRQGYDKVLTQRANLLSTEGFRNLHVDHPEDRALLRLLTMGRTTDIQQAELFSTTFNALDKIAKDQLVAGLNVDGIANETAVVPYYMPCLLSTVLETIKDWDHQTKNGALTSVWRFLAKVLSPHHGLSGGPENPGGDDRGQSGIVIERNLKSVLDIVKSPAFATDPAVLVDCELPRGQIQRRQSKTKSWEDL